MDATVTQTPSGGVRIVVHDEETDSLVTLRVHKSHGHLHARTGLRGNWDKDARPFREHGMSIEAPEVSKETRLGRRRKWMLDNYRRITG